MTDKEKIRKYEAAYSDIQAYVKRGNADPRIGIGEMFDEVVDLLDTAFGAGPCDGDGCRRQDTSVCPDCAFSLCPDCMPDMQQHDWIGHKEARP